MQCKYIASLQGYSTLKAPEGFTYLIYSGCWKAAITKTKDLADKKTVYGR